MSEQPALHPQLAPLAALLGSWEGEGAGDYPTIDAFTYRERVTFGHVGKPFLSYGQRTWHPAHGTPMHAEVGYLRLAADRSVELVLAHPTGIVEVEEGQLGDGVLNLATTTVGLSTTAKPVRALRREFRLQGDQLAYDVWMAHDQTPMTHHLHAVLQRTS